MDQIKSMKSQLESMLQVGLSAGCENIDAEEVRHITSAIKNLAETMYYCSVTKAMEEAEEVDDVRYGYNRSSRTGRFIRGYNRPMEHTYIDGYINDPYFRENMRMGYSDPGNNSSMGYSNHDRNMNDSMDKEQMTRNYDRHGRAYGDWSMAKKHYQESKNPEDKEKMKKHAMEHLNESVSTIQEIWDHADEEQRTRMKMAVDNLHHAMSE